MSKHKSIAVIQVIILGLGFVAMFVGIVILSIWVAKLFFTWIVMSFLTLFFTW